MSDPSILYRYTVDLRYSLWTAHNTAWQGYGYADLWNTLRDLEPRTSVEVTTIPLKEAFEGRVILTRLAGNHYEAHGTFTSRWGERDTIIGDCGLDCTSELDCELVEEALCFNAYGDPGVSRDFHFIESSLELVMLAIYHVDEMLLIQTTQEWEAFLQRAKDASRAWYAAPKGEV